MMDLDAILADNRRNLEALFPTAIHVEESPLPEPNAPFGDMAWRPALRHRHEIAYLSCRSWRTSSKALDLPLLRQVKRNLDPAVIDSCAAEIVGVVQSALGPLHGFTATSIAPGHSQLHDNFGVLLGQAVAAQLGIPWMRCFQDRFVRGSSHPKQQEHLPPLQWCEEPRTPILVVDDLATSGYHIEEAARLLRAKGLPCLAVSWLAREVK